MYSQTLEDPLILLYSVFACVEAVKVNSYDRDSIQVVATISAHWAYAMLRRYLNAALGALLWLTVNGQCKDYVIVSTRGTYEKQGASIAFKNMTFNTFAKVPHGSLYNTVYPASTEDGSVYKGAAAIVDFIDNGIRTCPQQSYALLGYSQGASATNIALRNYTRIGSPGYQAIKAVFLVGNPEHKPYQAANYDEKGGKTTNGFIGSGYFSGARTPEIWYQNTRLLDLCYIDDIVCNGPTADAAKNKLVNHVRYGNTASVQDIGTNFLIGSLYPDGY